VDRIGQTKPTFVHRFMIRNTIEELVFKLFKNNSTYSAAGSSSTSNAQMNANKPFCSRELEDVEMAEEKENNYKLTIHDIFNLFQEL
jgi:SNF2 family DNA or RNA helicase